MRQLVGVQRVDRQRLRVSNVLVAQVVREVPLWLVSLSALLSGRIFVPVEPIFAWVADAEFGRDLVDALEKAVEQLLDLLFGSLPRVDVAFLDEWLARPVDVLDEVVEGFAQRLSSAAKRFSAAQIQQVGDP